MRVVILAGGLGTRLREPALGVLAEAVAADDVEARLHGPAIQPVFRRA